MSGYQYSFFLLFNKTNTSNSSYKKTSTVALRNSTVFSTFQYFFIFNSLGHNFLHNFPSKELSSLRVALQFAAGHETFVGGTIVLSPPVPVETAVTTKDTIVREVVVQTIESDNE